MLPPEGIYAAAIKLKRGGFRNAFHDTIESLWRCLREADRDGHEVYYAVAAFASNRSREAENVRALRCFRLDIDYGGNGHKGNAYPSEKEAVADVRRFCVETKLPAPMIVTSGGGLHVYWPLGAALTRDAWQHSAEGLKAACIALGLKADPVVTADAARILRPPGTTNYKLVGKPRPVELDPRFLSIEPYEAEKFDGLLRFAPSCGAKIKTQPIGAPSRLGPRPAYLRPVDPERIAEFLGGLSSPLADANAVADGCAQLGLMRSTLGVMPEPVWHADLGLLAFCEDGERLAHEWSKGDPRYDQRETQEKFDRCKELRGATTCDRFTGLDDGARSRCQACPYKGAIGSPISLGKRAEPGHSIRPPTKPGGLQRASVHQWERTERGLKPKSLQNARRAIDELKIVGRYDVFHDKKLIEGDLPENASGELSDAIVRRIREMIYDTIQYDPGEDNVRTALEGLCEKNRFDPVSNYFDSLKWDGVRRLDTWLTDYLGAEDTPLNRAFGRKTLVAAVRRARQPGCKFDTMLVLEGPQGAGKSTAIRMLAGNENFTDQPIKWEDPKQHQEVVRGVLIHEISELAGVKKAEDESVKSFLSRQTDRCRPAYGRYVEDRPRRCIFIATTNSRWFLNDPTGARRIWPVKVGRIDNEALAGDRDQLWAEAAYVEARGEPITLETELYEAAKVQQELRQAMDPWGDILAGVSGEVVYTADGAVERITSEDLLGPRFLNIPPAQVNRTHYVRLSNVMRALGWNGPKVIRLKDREGRLAKGYERPVRD